MRKRFLSLAVTAVISMAVWTSAAGAAEPIGWTECGTEFKGECAEIEVPIDWAKPTGEKFKLAIGRLPALDPQKRIGVLFAGPGGPGVSGIDGYITGRRIPDNSPLRQHFDIVSFDPRGVSRSHQVRCSSELLNTPRWEVPKNEAQFKALRDVNAAIAADCRKHTGPLFDHVDTISAVRDIDAVRAVLGEERITFYGSSYGTMLGQQYAELFPSRLRASVLDSNVDHSISSAYEYLRTTAEELERSLGEFAGWCARTAACALHGRDVVAVWDGLHSRAVAGKLHDPENGRQIMPESLRGDLDAWMYTPARDWFKLATHLAELHAAPSARSAAPAPVVELRQNSHQAIWCSDFRWNVNTFAEFDAHLKRVEREVAPHAKLSPWWTDVGWCLGWSGPVNNPQHKLKIKSTSTTLVTTSRFDVAAPLSWNLAVHRQIPNSVLLHYDGAGHGQRVNSKCAWKHMTDYLITLTTPPPNTHCPAEYPTTPPAAASTRAGERPAFRN
ncbi:alpha/beta hydrolase [Allokutzneria sp. A3M-2-11 16]|uniref:alpha/beta fold hydrolase n=1 Tax=Allokutzneria sp. A3M-2-11 16 TaxID=2962043 RepID=UPI0020B8F5C0|nr:alpha/beta fold hydrolase [Allokutzneria sp. A3M-2-11 16]MCP3804093.1 alpha/beta hydrolase [Allokutzneria sp. A3M-2-11 16]